jgi:uncharacterized protein (UPF0216 family)
MRLNENVKKDLLKRIKQLEDIIESENIFESVQNLDGFNMLNNDELVVISKGMDKTDYRKYNQPRWMDLKSIVENVIKIKKLYAGWVLKNVSQAGQYDCMPPQNFYSYKYKTPEGNYFNCGGIERIE